MSQHSVDLAVFLFVVALRLGIPLFVPRFPLPAMIAAMLIDAADQTIFQKFTHLDLTNYQGYDKALDVYYLSIAYLSTMRNWANMTAFRTSRFLYFYRMVGVVLFELLHIRAILLIFPNTFEYFFDFYEAVRLRWNPIRMTKRLVIGSAAFIWIFIKLPQEYWIHVAQLDTTDLIREYPIAAAIIAVVAVVALIAAYKIIWPKLPPKEWKLEFDVDKRPDVPMDQVKQERLTSAERLWDSVLVEKVALVGMIAIIFGRVLPNVEATDIQLTVGIAVIIVANTLVSHWFTRRGREWSNIFAEFGAMAAVNAGLTVLAFYILPLTDNSIHLGSTLFFLLMLTMIIVLYDRYHPRYLARLEGAAPAPA
jgi:hypothetical protein